MNHHLTHYTLNTGHSRESPRSEVGDDIIERCRELIVTGEHSLPFPGQFTIKTTNEGGGLLATVFAGQVPIVTIAVARTNEDAKTLWPQIEGLYHKVTEMPGHRQADWELAKEPVMLPWLSVAIIAQQFYLPWLGDFERCIAWAWIEDES